MQQVWVWIVWWYIIDWYDLTKLTTFKTGQVSFVSINSLNVKGIIPSSFSSDVPFTNGAYTHGTNAFNSISSASIISESGYIINQLSLDSKRLLDCITNKGCLSTEKFEWR